MAVSNKRTARAGKGATLKSSPCQTRTSYWACLVILLTAGTNAQSVSISVFNPSPAERSNEPVIVPWSELRNAFSSKDFGRLRLVDGSNRSLPFQIDDLDGDRTPDELAFQLTLDAKETREVILTAERDSLASPHGPLRTDAANYKRISGRSQPIDDDDGPGTLRRDGHYPFDGVGWESEVIAYRLYLDERNAIDIQGKRLPGLHWNFIGSSGVDYQKDAYWGMDVLHVGPALGIGGFGFWANDSVAHPYMLDRRRTRIVARGPVRCIVSVEYKGWDIGKEKVDVTSILSLFSADRFTENRLYLRSGAPQTVATGIVKHATAKGSWDGATSTLMTIGAQSRSGDSLMMALAFTPASVVQKREDAPNHLVLLRITKDEPLRYLIFSRWQGEGAARWDQELLSSDVVSAHRRLNEPLRVRISISGNKKH